MFSSSATADATHPRGVVAMWNGDINGESSAEVTATETPSLEVQVQNLISERDENKAAAERWLAAFNRLETRYASAGEQLRGMVESADDVSDGYITFSLDDLKELCSRLNVSVTNTVTYEACVTIRFQAELPIWADADSISTYEVDVEDPEVTVDGVDDIYVESCNVDSVDRAN